jgi:hypothetical protein
MMDRHALRDNLPPFLLRTRLFVDDVFLLV